MVVGKLNLMEVSQGASGEEPMAKKMSLKESGILKLWDNNSYAAFRDENYTKEDFITDIASEYDENVTPGQVTKKYMIHRCVACPEDVSYDNDWWEVVDKPGRGRVKVWYADLTK